MASASVIAGPSLMVNSILSGLEVQEVGLDRERDVQGPDDPVMCGRLKNSESLCQLYSC